MSKPSRTRSTLTEADRRLRRTANVVAVLAIGTLAGVLIWTKLKLVSPIPRTAFADPPRQVDNAEATHTGSDLPPPPLETAEITDFVFISPEPF
ncbi:MAG: hypothetical protein AAGI17_02420 [Planctomycetota bacterium]